MTNKIVYKKKQLLGNNPHNSGAMRDISKKDKKYNVVNQSSEKKQLFNELKKHRAGGVTEKEMKGVLAGLKYGSSDFTKKEINLLAKELQLGEIRKKHIQSKSLRHVSRIDRANHDANSYGSNKNARNSGVNNRYSQDDDITHFESNKFIRDIFKGKNKKMIVDGETVFNKEEESFEFFDQKSGKRFVGTATKLTRPNLNTKSHSSLRGRGIIAGTKNM